MGLSLKKLGDQLNPFDGGRSYQTQVTNADRAKLANQQLNQARAQSLQKAASMGNVQSQNKLKTNNYQVKYKAPPSFRQNMENATGTVGLGLYRSALGTAQGLSGIYDLATPGLGTNRYSKELDTMAKRSDEIQKQQGRSEIGYKAGQFLGDALTFTAGGSAFAKGASTVGKLKPVSSVINSKPVLKLTAPGTKALENLAGSGAKGRIAAAGVRGVTAPGNVANITADTGFGLGQMASKGQDIGPEDVALQAGISTTFGAGLPMTAQAVKELKVPTIKASKATAKAGKVIAKSQIDAPGALRKAQANEAVAKARLDASWQKLGDAKTNGRPYASLDTQYKRDLVAYNKARAITKAAEINNKKLGLYVEDVSPKTEGVAPTLNGKPIETVDGDVVLYHRTNKANANQIRKTGKLDPSKAGTGNDKAITEDGRVSYLTTNDSQDFYGGEVIKVRMPKAEYEKAIKQNADIIAKLEKELADGKVPEMYIPATKAQIENIRNNPEILSNKPLSILESTPPKGVAPKSAPIEKTPTVKVAEPAPKPKVTVKKTVETPPPTKKPNVAQSNKPVKPAVTKKKGFNDYVDDIAQSQGIDTTYNAPGMFTFNKGLTATSKAINKTPLRVLTRGKEINNLMQINPIRKGVQATEDALSAQAKKANVSRKGSKTLNTSRTVFAQTGISDADRMANRRFRDAQTLSGDLTRGEMRMADDMVSKLPDPEKSLDNVYRYVADDKILERTHGKGARPKLSDLSPEEQAIANKIVAIQKRTNEINYKIGKITKEQFTNESKKGHYARIFNIKDKGGKQLGKKPIDTKPFEKRKDPAEFSDEVMELLVKDPFRGALARQEIALRSLASHEFMGELASQGRLLKNKPNKGFQQLNGKKYGKYDGMWADNTTRAQIKQNMEFESDWAKKYVGQLVDDYKASVMGKTQRALKATKTVLNPGTNVQNVMSNILFFNRGSGVGIIRNATGMAKAAKDLTQARNGNLTAELIQAKKLGVFGSDSGKAMTGDIAAQDLASIPGKKNVVMKGLEIAEDAYGGADNAAKLGLWRNLQKKGLSAEAAATQVQKFTQDYHNVGRVIGAMADAPVLGKPFARFIPELIRLSKNNIAYNPAATIASLAALAYTANALSEAAGETDEERANREAVIGNTNLPGTSAVNKMLGGPDRDISLNFAVGDSSVNIARAIGLNFPTEPGQDPNRALLEQILPFEIPTRKDAQGNEVFDPTKIVTHLGLRPLIETAVDRNFMGQSIKDPENKVRVEGSELGKVYQGDISKTEQRKNVASHLARAYLPMGNEIDSVVSAFKGEPNSMGKERTPGQALLRTVGIKVEKNDQAARDKRASTKEFFEGKVGQVNDFLNKNPDLKDTYLKVKSGTKDRSTGKKVVDLVTPEKWQVIAGEKSGRLFEQLKAEDEYQNKQDSSYPVDPIFSNQLSKEQRNQILQIRASYSGDNIEQEEILRATKPWYQNFEAAERDRSTKLSAYFDKLKAEGKLSGDTQNERVKAYGELYDKYSPKQTPLMTKYYQLRESNPEAAKNIFKTNPELSDQFDAYKEQKLKYINEKRKIEGVPPIDRNTFMNVTFGYEDDERKVYNELKYGKGYGGYGSGGGGGGSSTASLNALKYALPLSAGGKFKAPVASKGKAVKVGVKRKDTTAKPKVSIKKSLV